MAFAVAFTFWGCDPEETAVELTCTVAKTDVTVYGGNDGTITVTVVTGNEGYEYTLTSTTTVTNATGNFTGLVAGDYSVSVTDQEGKVWTISVTISQPNPDDLVCTVTHTNVTTFGGNDGTITVTVVSGYEPYTFTLNESITSEDGLFTELVAGNYNLKVVDDLDREFTETITITEPGQLTMSIEHTNVLCFGESNGTITVTASGETGTYEYKLNDGDFQSSNEFTDLYADTYTVTVKSGEVTISDDVTITQPTEPVGFVGDPIVVNASTFQGKGSIKVTATGGTSPYLYKLDDGDYVNNGGEFEVYPGTYSVTAKDANSCTVTVSDIVVINVNTFLPVIQDVTVTDKTETSAKINFKINPFGTTTSFYIEYGTTTSYGNTITLNNVSGSSLIDVSKNITDLVHGTVYYYNIVAENSDGTTNVSGSFSTMYIIGDEIDGGKVFFINSYVYMGVPTSDYWVIKNQDEPGLYDRDYLYTLPNPNQGWALLEMTSNYKDEMISNINSLNDVNGFISPIENEKYWVGYGGWQTITFPNGVIEPKVEGESYRLRLYKFVRIEY